ncbi:hypothetical protein PybrP1_007658 [[Pythium] brassicae (nom. inval.)]|nr:hypothetical protein PybrP1_007658 [[Pythium] brassicae (nom. inval.)]
MTTIKLPEQAAFRGFRTRQRVVWHVRAEIDAFVAELQRDARVAQLLLGGGTLCADARWLVEGERRCRLHLPRFEDDHVFGVPSARADEAPVVRTRYAPSPTGYLHLGGLRTALFNYLFARSTGGQFLLRIEDTDKTRQVEGSIEALINSLKWCGVEEDEGPTKGGPHAPYIQSQRLETYREHADRLLECGHAYRCFCTPERLANLRASQTRNGDATMYDRACLGLAPEDVVARVARGEPHTIRLKIPVGKTVVKDLLRGYVQFEHAGIDDQVLMKSDGYPTYHLANVVDDHAMGISHVIRGEEWLPSTPKHVLLYKALGFTAPQFAHLGLLLNEDRSKLSKRQGDVAVEDFRDKGYLPSGLVNFVALLGWNPAGGNNQEIFDMTELERHFSLENVNKAGSVVNVERLRWINSRHIRALFADDAVSAERQQAVIDDERVSALPEFGPLCVPFFVDPDLSSPDAQEMKAKYIGEDTDGIVDEVVAKLRSLSDDAFNSDDITKAVKEVAKSRKLGLKKVLMPIRYYLTGMEVGAGLGDTVKLLGRDTALRRLQQRA